MRKAHAVSVADKDLSETPNIDPEEVISAVIRVIPPAEPAPPCCLFEGHRSQTECVLGLTAVVMEEMVDLKKIVDSKIGES
jgi:hypothetical protein